MNLLRWLAKVYLIVFAMALAVVGVALCACGWGIYDLWITHHQIVAIAIVAVILAFICAGVVTFPDW